MPPSDDKELNKIEELKKKLFSRQTPTIIEHRDTFSDYTDAHVPPSWSAGPEGLNFWEKIFMRTPVFKKFFLFAVGFFIISVFYASYIIFFKGNIVSNDNIDIAVLGNTFTAGGEELSLIVEITNRNNTSLDLVDLVIEYPKGSLEGLFQDTERYRESLGSIPAGGVRNENVKMVLFGEQGSVRPIKISVEYRVEGSNAIFVKERMYEVAIDSTPLDISIKGPTTASPNQDVTMEIKSTLNSTKPVSKVLLRVDYPPGFKFSSAKPAPAFGDNVWNLGDLASGAEQTTTITGKMIDVFEGEEKVFRIQSGSQSSADKSSIDVVFNSLAYSLSIQKPSIEARLYINGVYQSEHAVEAKNKITGEIRWANNIETKINDFAIRAKFSGNTLDRRAISTGQGFYNSLEDAIVWDKNYINQFREVNPGDSGAVTFSFTPISLFSAASGLLQDPAIFIDVSVTGKQPLDSYVSTSLINQELTTIKITSDVGFAARALYYSGPFTNKGPIPPKAEQETTYTITWTLSNTANAISKAKVSSTLPPWIKFLETTSFTGDDLSYNPSSKELIWNVGTIPRGAGITSAGKEISFQISFIPSLSQIGTAPVLINGATLTGVDDFANVNVTVNKAALTTRLVNDPAFPSDGDRVVE